MQRQKPPAPKLGHLTCLLLKSAILLAPPCPYQAPATIGVICSVRAALAAQILAVKGT